MKAYQVWDNGSLEGYSTVAYMDVRVRALERRLLALEELAASPTMILSAGEDRPRHPGVLASLLLWLRGRKAEN